MWIRLYKAYRNAEQRITEEKPGVLLHCCNLRAQLDLLRLTNAVDNRNDDRESGKPNIYKLQKQWETSFNALTRQSIDCGILK